MLLNPHRFGAASVGGDPSFANVSLLLHCDGVDGSTSIIDSSSSPRVLTPVGNAALSTEFSKFGLSSMKFDGTGDYYTTPYSTALDFGSGDFTVEFSVYHTTNPNDGRFHIYLHSTSSDASNSGWMFYKQSNGIVICSIKGLGSLSAPLLTLNTWHHLALCRSGTTYHLFRDGVLASTNTSSLSLSNVLAPLQIGGGQSTGTFGTNSLIGHIDEVRLTKGVARYTANFTPPTAPFPDF